MSEPITEVWAVMVEGIGALGLYAVKDEAESHAARSRPTFLGKLTIERLPLATPEMVECVNAVRQFGDFAGKVEAQSKQGADLSERFDLAEERSMCHGRLLLAAQNLAAIDAARAAGGAHGP